LSSEEMEKLSADSKVLRIEQHQKQFVVSDDSGEPRTLYPDGKKHTEKDVNGNKTATKTKWEGSELVVETKVGRSGKLTESYRVGPEGKQLFPQMTVEENLLVGSTCRRGRGARAESLEEVYGLFPDLADRRKQEAGSLSGGEQQMVAVGRALMAKPKLLAMDEPSLGLAPVVVDRLFEVLQTIRKIGLTLLIIEQNVQQVLEMADRGYVMENGQIVLTGSGQELLRNEHLQAHYLGV